MNDHDHDELRQRLRQLRHDADTALWDCRADDHARLTGEADDLVLAIAAQGMKQQAAQAAVDAEQTSADARAASINAAFGAQFGDLDDHAFADAAAIARARMDDPAFAKMSAAEFAQEIGGRVRRMQQQPEPNAVTTVPARSEVPQAPGVEQLRRSSARAYVGERIARQFKTTKG